MSELNLNQSKFAQKCGLHPSNLSAILNEKRPCEDAVLNKIILSCDTSKEWLLYGEGEMINPKEHSNIKAISSYVKPEIGDPSVYRIPALPVSAQATFAENLDSNNYINPLEDFRDIQLQPEELPIKDNLVTIQVDGESMERTLIDGAWVLTRRVKDSQWGNMGGVIFVSYGDYFVVKRIKSNKLFTENYMVLSSDNKEYGEMTVQLCDIRAMFKAIRIISSPIL